MGAVAGLRELKKQRTRAAIQEHALRLFTEQGYDATTIEQIAAAAEISPATFFRYFPTKEDLLIQDDHDPLLTAALLAAPPDMPTVAAVRKAMRDVFGNMPEEQLASIKVRLRMIVSVPSARARAIDNIMASVDVLAEPLGRRQGVPATDPRVRAQAGALIGAMTAGALGWVGDDGPGDLRDVVDDALAALDGLTG
ncbi:hypothetical protein Val02_86210 [Virgisporangium aliadipatigenens]|uniref:HTH tetR-type domain-containing protein n=1 Tax=Virgisporangium aliadipatigenens TaxID=741659 RepID=A0A8J3YXS5_9ACTN|nr:TetR family transcriptional regulator [Virgisporangium aliadipatigenens]GIJ51735.1 hypothetical protein Val02_86210 [Virgisporangium aliadipatigenens]